MKENHLIRNLRMLRNVQYFILLYDIFVTFSLVTQSKHILLTKLKFPILFRFRTTYLNCIIINRVVVRKVLPNDVIVGRILKPGLIIVYFNRREIVSYLLNYCNQSQLFVRQLLENRNP